MAAFDLPDGFPMVDANNVSTMPWVQWFTRVHNLALSLYQSGTTANRPTTLLWIGRRYYDTTLGYPVWVHAVSPAVVWHNGAGAAV